MPATNRPNNCFSCSRN